MSAVLEQVQLEQVGSEFSEEPMLMVRQKTRNIIHEIAARCEPGMIEEDAVEIAKEILAANRMLRGWHDVYVRFGSNTTKTFGADSDPGVVLKENDIMFVDIGPVFEKLEGDGGDTFVFGSDADMARCAEDARKLFHIVRKKWLSDGSTGKVLYEFAVEQAQALGWELNMDLSGHRVSDFPHAAVYEGPMADVDFCPSRLLWVLEIHIRHPKLSYGAFFEDMLLEDKYFA
ncbi:M24 family metallopeptidase [Paraburkholderia sp.]|uniref:M24 family metallopeptidase n=1 Tax=Paraburkholderia sp. TaxID=1926495 RepID=UPI0023958E94|nr:M24 family metallopeptidase [Paraburkholderia sp.]MDE1180968.1 M24 family metallopeptidase [Paraburkholderia sp.]